MPKVSLCIPQYNRCHQLRLVIQDILAQSYSDYELLIVDDCSTDQTPEVVAEFNDPRITYSRNERNLGLYPNFNRCLELAKGEYIAIYHNHDRYAPDIVEQSVQLLDQYPQVGFVHTGTQSTTPNGVPRSYVQNWPQVSDGRWFIFHLIKRWDSPVHQPTVMARRSMYDQVGLFDVDTYSACADSPIWMQMSFLADVGYVPLPLMKVTPRTEQDYYGVFRWQDVVGMTRAHRFGLELLRENWDEARYRSEKKKLQVRIDRRFLLLLAQWTARGDEYRIADGLRTIEQEGSPRALWLAHQLVAIARMGRPALYFMSKVYGKSVRLKGQWDNLQGQRISDKYRKGNN